MGQKKRNKAELNSERKTVSLVFGDLTVQKIIPPPKDAKQTDKVKILTRQEVIRTIKTLVHQVIQGVKVFESPEYKDIRTKTIRIKKSILEDNNIQEGSILKGEFIRRTCSDKPFWDGQKQMSSKYYSTTDLVGIDRIEEGDILLIGEERSKILATERDIYISEGKIIKNIRIKEKSTILVK